MIYHGDALNYIYETPQILRHILEEEDNILVQAKALLKEQEISEVFLTGSGSSYHAAAAAASFAKKELGIRTEAVYPAALSKECGLISNKALVLGISQQGTSMGVIHTLDTAGSRGVPVIAVTGEYHTEITKHGDATLYVECGYEDAGATTKGYTASVLTLLLFFIMLGEESGRITKQAGKEYRQRIQAVVRNINLVLEQCRPWCNEMAECIRDCRDFIIIAGSNLQSLLLESVLKFSETCRFPVRGYEAEEFMHGMYNGVTENTSLLYLCPAFGEEREQIKKLYQYYEYKKVTQYMIDLSNPLFGFLNDMDFSILEYSLLQQMLFVLASRLRGINLNIPKDPDFHKYMGSKQEQEHV